MIQYCANSTLLIEATPHLSCLMAIEATPHLYGLTGLTIAMPPLLSPKAIKAMPLLFSLTGIEATPPLLEMRPVFMLFYKLVLEAVGRKHVHVGGLRGTSQVT